MESLNEYNDDMCISTLDFASHENIEENELASLFNNVQVYNSII